MQKYKRYTFHQFEIPLITDKETQPSELAVSDQDVERTSTSSVLLGDPFQLSDGIVPDEQIASLRHRKKGKRVAKYQLRQNNVCVARSLQLSQIIIIPRQLISSLLKPMEEHTEDAKVSEEVAKLPVGRISHHKYFF